MDPSHTRRDECIQKNGSTEAHHHQAPVLQWEKSRGERRKIRDTREASLRRGIEKLGVSALRRRRGKDGQSRESGKSDPFHQKKNPPKSISVTVESMLIINPYV